VVVVVVVSVLLVGGCVECCRQPLSHSVALAKSGSPHIAVGGWRLASSLDTRS
jgi:hypothetical protein